MQEAFPKPISPSRRSAALGYVLCISILTAAALVRIPGAFNDLNLDEIWSLDLVGTISSPMGIFTKLHHDNNHYLNSLWMYLIGPHCDWVGYRIPSLLAGIGTVVVAGLIGYRRSLVNAWMAMLLVGCSYVLILYSDQARGYSCLVCCCLLAYYWLDRYLTTRKSLFAILFALTAVCGFLSQLTCVSFFVSAFIWSVWRLIRSRRPPRQIAAALLLCYAIPSLFLLVLYLIDIRHMVIGGGTPTTLWIGYPTAIAWIVAPAAQGADTWVAFSAVSVALICGCVLLRGDKVDSLVLYIAVILVVPVCVALLRHATLLYVRYFLVAISFSLLLLSTAMASLWERGWKSRVVCLCLLAGYGFANGRDILVLLKDGQGDFSETVTFLKRRSRRPVITVGGDQDSRIKIMLQFYGPQQLGTREAVYYPIGGWPPAGPEWVICQKESIGAAVSDGEQLADRTGNLYKLAKIVPSAPLASVHWFLYHNLER
jgi:hypothetical protein